MEIGLGNLPALPGSLTQLSWANLRDRECHDDFPGDHHRCDQGGRFVRQRSDADYSGTWYSGIALDTMAGVLFGKLLYLLMHGRFNPLIGAAGISAFPMAARVVNKVGLEEDYDIFLLMHAMGANAAGQVASVVAGGILLALVAR